MTKTELRKIKQAERDSLDSSLHKEWSEALANNVAQTFEYLYCETLHVYLSFRSEPDTSILIQKAWNDGKNVVVPTIDSATKQMIHVHYLQGDELQPDAFGVPTPVNLNQVSVSELRNGKTMVIVPLLAFNEDFFRLGYGKGYYDEFLRGTGLATFGYGFSFQYTDALHPESHDVPLDNIITEQGVARRKRS